MGVASRRGLHMSEYLKAKLDRLWSDKFCFGKLLNEAVAAHPDCKLLFAGISHGAALAQAAGLRLALRRPELSSRISIVSWNAYKWTDTAGSALVGQQFGDRILPLVLSRGNPRRWDSAAEIPPGFAPMPGITLLDSDTGEFYDNVVLGNAHISVDSLSRLKELHFAKGALQAMKTATTRVLDEEQSSSQNSLSAMIHSLSRKSISSIAKRVSSSTIAKRVSSSTFVQKASSLASIS